ncbi:protein PHLOEM PROTEIN 2-LIKE A9-like [Phalaenopsis equestris]|uniref:protein PHLOEM PROTEIN 2-LIKE A9-like n=1 Tax=Phalaenopsis equestris TaxID=78828 RepID=UPI0009E1DC12|nr:protein PHLOEM PROTEIN 2-LIKE A9-like [Phalaenopsis equestris]XP_020596754.1 protein PHLOEM PROTEIN 2-LIKE A9-like [Phalaenopsis equestris]
MSHSKGEISEELVIYDQEKGTLTLKPRALDITWGADPTYWKFSSTDPTSPAELLQVCWLEVKGKAKLSYFVPEKRYAVKFKVELKPDNFGWAKQPVYLMAKIDRSQRSWKKADLSINPPGTKFDVPMNGLLTFRVPKDADGKVVEFGMYEIWRGRWKGGLVIHEVVIQPVSS